MAVFEFRNAQDVGRVLKHHGVKYLLLYAEQEEIRRGKDFIQLRNGPFDLDLIFAPDGIERFDDAWKRRVEKHGFPFANIDGIIGSKQAANRQKGKC